VDDKKRYWVGFNLVKGIGSVRTQRLLDYFGDLETAWHAPISAFQAVKFSNKVIKALDEIRSGDILEKTWKKIQQHDIEVVIWDDVEYPMLLKNIPHPPPVLYIRGDIQPNDEWSIAIVGTRRATNYGKQATIDIVGFLARNRITVVSGLARGIDGVAHDESLKSGGRTIAVLGSGVDIIYPPEHRKLAERIIENGALISDYPPGTSVEASNFPPRNRIISGMSRAVVVIEAGRKSGALITAAFAVEQGKDVFAVPGTIYAPQSSGANLLIQQGAFPLLNPNDLIEVLDLSLVNKQRDARTVLPSNSTESQIYNLLLLESLHVDEIQEQANLPIEEVSAALTIMELKGMIKQIGSMRYMAVHESDGSYETESKN